ncbi:hypothetical protein C8R43DRAFT_445874 [Mycena crocata]|nr:hypothetical protein C8R43DRAFT_445874 [Mycena crocata]
MFSLLEHVPHDVLQHIALLGASPGFEPPLDLCCLLATCRALYDGLNLHASPHLYAAIFRLKYDDVATNHTSHWRNSSLASELVQRCRALRRCHRLDISLRGLRQDLWTLLWMVLEEGRCIPLSEAGFSKFILELARYYLEEETRPCDEIISLVIWLLCLGLSRQEILLQNPEARSTLLMLLRPFVSASALRVPTFTSRPPSSAVVFHPAAHDRVSAAAIGLAPSHVDSQDPEDEVLMRYNTRICSPPLPPPSDAAIILIFALKEAVSLEIPFHLPASRAIAIAENRSGPTAEDYTAFQRARTLLFTDVRAAVTAPSAAATLNFMQLDPWIAQVLEAPGAAEKRASRSGYTPGCLTGIWEGSLMISSCVSPGALNVNNAPARPTDFLCRTPMQCKFFEFFGPLPLGTDAQRILQRKVVVPQDSKTFENLPYRKFIPGETVSQHGSSQRSLDHVLIGQTLREHEDAWGLGFNFAGRVYDNGLIVFTRRPKTDESEMSETWVFEGHLRYGTALVGTFRSSSSDDLCGVQGIFSLRQRAEE